jgi:hypothetical protein
MSSPISSPVITTDGDIAECDSNPESETDSDSDCETFNDENPKSFFPFPHQIISYTSQSSSFFTKPPPSIYSHQCDSDEDEIGLNLDLIFDITRDNPSLEKQEEHLDEIKYLVFEGKLKEHHISEEFIDNLIVCGDQGPVYHKMLMWLTNFIPKERWANFHKKTKIHH